MEEDSGPEAVRPPVHPAQEQADQEGRDGLPGIEVHEGEQKRRPGDGLPGLHPGQHAAKHHPAAVEN